jgi:hyperosmotically inducible protein
MRYTKIGLGLAVVVALMASPALLQASKTPLSLDQQVLHELLMLPYYGVFDTLSYTVSGDKVTLAGQVTRPALKNEAEKAVARVPGVSAVDNRIEVLPLSRFDDQIRLATYWAVYGNPTLLRYNLGAQAPIRIVVKNGNVTLEGVVATQMDKILAGTAANGVGGAFSVTNHLQVKVS